MKSSYSQKSGLRKDVTTDKTMRCCTCISRNRSRVTKWVSMEREFLVELGNGMLFVASLLSAFLEAWFVKMVLVAPK